MADMGPRVLAGRYRLSDELGRGGMGVVWLADDELIGRRVAIKELRAPAHLPPADRAVVAKRALAEGRNAARVRHPNAVTLHDVIPVTADDDAVYLIMELVQAPNLAQIVVREGRLSEDRVTSIAVQLLNVLDAAHALGVVHRDVKPSNIIIEPGDTVKLADFGIAHAEADTRLTEVGVIGTQAYMAPELFRGADIHPSADLWSAGATLFYAAEGAGPFDRATTVATLNAVLMEEIPHPTCRRPLADAISALLVRDPARRATSRQTRDILQGYGAPAWPGQVGARYEDARGDRVEQSNTVTARVLSHGSAQPTPPWDEPPITPEPASKPKPAPGPRFLRPALMAPTFMLIAAVFAVSMWWITSHAGQVSAANAPTDGSGHGASASASASPAYGDQVFISELAPGQCLDNGYTVDENGNDAPTLADCAQPHDAEVIAVFPLASQADGSDGAGDATCTTDIGRLFSADTIPSGYDYRLAVPSASAWNDGYHDAACMIVGADEGQISDVFTPETSSS
jgi:serine/threonine protein kinase